MSSQSSDGQYPGQRPGQYPDPSASQPPAQPYPQPGQNQPGYPPPGYGSGYRPGYTPSSQVGGQMGAQSPFQPVGTAYGYGGPGQQGPQPPKKNTGLIVGVVSAVVIALVASGVGAFLLLRGDNDDAAPTANTTTTAPATSTRPEPSGEPTRTKRPSKSPTPSASPSAAAGSQEVTGPVTGVTFSVPKGWTTGVGGAPDAGGVLDADITSDLDAYAYGSSGLKQVQLQKGVAPLSTAPSEDMLKTVLSRKGGATFSSYETFTTPNGDGAVAYFSLDKDGITIYGALIEPKTSTGGYATLTTAAFTEPQSKELTQSVIASIR